MTAHGLAQVTIGEVDKVIGPAGSDFVEVLRTLASRGAGPFLLAPDEPERFVVREHFRPV
jgi:hypothetical protein